MKKVIIGIAAVLCLTMGFAVCGSETYPTSTSMPGAPVAKAFASQTAPGIQVFQEQSDQDASIFSRTTIFYLCAAVIVVVTVRRRT